LTAPLPRAALFKQLDQARRHALTVWVVAPAGAGKTMLAASYLKNSRAKHLWYQLDAGDADPATFFYYLREAAARMVPRARQVLPLFTPEYLMGLGTYTQNFFTQLGALFKTPFLLVFDNVQRLPDDCSIHALLAEGLATLPERANALFLSHNEPPAAYARLQVQRRQAVVGGEQLLLTLAETQALAQRYRFKTLTPQAVSSLHDRTHGWAAGMVLMLEQAAQERNPAPQFDQPVARTMFNYFASEVLHRAPLAHQQVLLKTAILPQVSARAAETLSGEKQAERILAELARRHYFTYRLPGVEPVYQYHPLFREFLHTQLLQTVTPQDLAALHCRAAGLAEAAGNIEDAVMLWREAGAWDELTRCLCGSAQTLLKQGRSKLLVAWIEAIPPAHRDHHPWLLFWLGQSCLADNPAEARSHYEHAHACFLSRQERDGALLAWAGIVDTIVHEYDDITRLDPWIEWLNAQMVATAELPAGAIGFRVISSMAVALMFRRGRREEVQPWIERASAVLVQLPDLSARCRLAVYLALYATWTGDLNRLETLALDLHRWSQQVQGGSRPGIEAQYANYVQSLHEWIAGIPDYGLQVSNETLVMIEESGIRLLGRHIMARAAFGVLCSGALIEAKEYLDRLQRMAAATLSSRLHWFQYHYLPGWYSLLAGDIAKALQEAQKSLQVSHEAGMTAFHRGFSNIVAAHALLDMQCREEAQPYIATVIEIARDFGSPILEFSGLLLQATSDLSRGDASCHQQGLAALRRALALGKRCNYMNTVVWHPTAMAALCQTALEHHIEVGYVQDMIRRRALPPPLSSGQLENWPWSIRLYTFGRFALVKDGQPVQFEGKAQKKTLELLKALVALGGREVSEQRLCDILWPDAEADDARRNLKITLHRLRKIVGHEALILQDSKLQLDINRCWVDVWTFERLVSRILANDDPLSAAELQHVGDQMLALYRGPFLAADDAFAMMARERLRGRLMRAIAAAAARLQRDGAHDQTIAWYERGIEIEPLAEPFYQSLMRVYQVLRRPAEGLGVYQRCRTILAAELKVVPSHETEALARALRGIGA
jgi:DNA-binding SARP family transcriptional activator